MPDTSIVIVGGGYAGVEAAKKLHKKFKKDWTVTITLIDKNPYHTLMTELHEVAGCRVEPDSVKVSFDRIFAGRRVNVVLDTVKTVDFAAQKVVGEEDSYGYDYLVLGSGGEPEYFGIPGVKDHSFTLWSLDDALAIRNHVEDMFHTASREPDAEKRKSLLTFVVAGAGFTGIEMAGEFIDHRRELCRQYGIDEKEVRIIVVEAMENILPILDEKLQNKATKYMRKHNVELMLDSPIVEAWEGGFTLKDGTEVSTGTFIWTCGVMGSEFAGNLALTKGRCSNRECQWAKTDGTCAQKDCEFKIKKNSRYIIGKRGRLEVNKFMQSVDYDNVYIVGDNLWYVEDKQVLPQIVEAALQTAEVAVKNIIASMQGTDKHEFKSNFHGFMVSIGGKYAVSDTAGIKLSGFFAMALKHFINLHYLFGLAGFNAVWSYLRHEILDIEDRRSLVGGHLSEKVPIYWVAVLRVFLGVMWLIEGVKKILDGWLNPENIYIVPVDAGTAATEGEWAAESAAAAVTPLLQEPSIIYNWIVDTFVSIAPFFVQACLVLGEIGIGLALIGGLFTFLASIASIGLALMFILGAMAGKEILWYIAASIVMLGGAGRGLGLDYWVMPFIKKIWNKTGLAKKTYLYSGEPE
jgi:NADH:ubiquinone reductase (H+-translocating)